MRFLYLIFFLSGVPALVYQVVWQRALFTILGVNVESVALVVTAFMLGLGLGSLAGGAVSKRPRIPPLLAFSVIELLIGTFGFFSLTLFNRAGQLTLASSGLVTFLVAFSLVLVPTLLMGATLPLLVTHLVTHLRNVGRSVGLLYFVNTLGSGVASLMCSIWVLGRLGMHGSVRLAVVMNLIVGSCALVAYLRHRRGAAATGEGGVELAEGSGGTPVLSPLQAMLLVAVCGFISLSYEIIWVRVFAFLTGGVASAFPLVLGAFLVGLALGSLISTWFCQDTPNAASRPLRSLAGFLYLANAIGFFVVPLTTWSAGHSWILRYVAPLSAVAIAAAMLGAALPIISHSSVRPDNRVGAGLSYLYVANIIGSAAGSLLTGFVLMDHWPLQSIALFLAVLGLVVAAMLALNTRLGVARGLIPVAVTGGLLALMAGPLFDRTWERLQYKRDWTAQRFAVVVENKSGVVTVDQDAVIYGDGVYDGAFNVDLRHDVNHIDRAFAVGLLHPAPKQMLMIGLASGSWGQVLANHPDLEHLTVVEINPAYLGLVRSHPLVASLLDNPKVTFVIDDGRRWLNRHKDRKFDLIVMNTSFHWRGMVTNLLSTEFLQLTRSHLNPGGVFYYNTTASNDAQRTGAEAYAHALRVYNFIAVSDSPFDLDQPRWRRVLERYVIDGTPVLDFQRPEDRQFVDGLLERARARAEPGTDAAAHVWTEPRESILLRTRAASVITDDNMITEWTEAAGSPGPLVLRALRRWSERKPPDGRRGEL